MRLIVDENGFEIIFKAKESKGFVKRHIDVDIHSSDYPYIEQIAKDKAIKGDKVEIMPTLDIADDPRRKKLFKGKNPDLRINKNYVEVEGVKKTRSEL
jgi:hypothetical protein